MGKISKASFCQFLFILCVAIPSLNIYELTFCIWSITLLVTLKKRYSLTVLQYAGYFILIFLLAFISSLFRDHKLYDYIKDITFMAKPIIGLLIGYQLCKEYYDNPLKVVVNTTVFIAVAHLLVVFYSIVFLHLRDMHQLRMNSGYFNDFEVYGLVIIIFQKRFGINLTRQKHILFLLIVSASVTLYLARTNFIQLAILCMAVKGYFAVNRSSIIIFSSLLAFAVVSYTIIYNINPRRSSKGIEAFLYKIKIAPEEAFKTKVDVTDWKDFNDNYRSYENILTIRQMSNDGFGTVMFGRGLGSHINLKTEVWLQTSNMRLIPFLHNGFMTVFLKAGIVGLIIYLQTILFYFRQKKSVIPLVSNINLLFLATGIFIIISNWVFLGFYNLFDTKIVLIGFLMAYREQLIKNHQA